MTNIKTSGLKLRPTYDELVNQKQDKIKLPNRLATQLRNSNQLSNLLDGDGEGLLSMELQQQNIIREQLKALTINTMADANSTAKVLKIASTQTGGINPYGNSQVFNLPNNDPEEQLSDDIEMVSTQQAQNQTKITNLLQAHFDDMSPNSMDIAHVIASSGGASSSNYMPPNMEGIPLNDPNMSEITQKPKAKGRPKKIQQSVTDPMLIDKELKRPPEEELEKRGKVGRPKKIQQSVTDPMLIDKELKRTQTKTPDESPLKKKFKKHSDKLHPILNKLSPKKQEVESTNDDEPEPETAPQKASFNVKKAAITKQTVTQNQTKNKISPSVIGIQLLRELLEDAKNKNKLSSEDSFAYTKLLIEWLAAKGQPEIKKENMSGLRAIYKRALYKK